MKRWQTSRARVAAIFAGQGQPALRLIALAGRHLWPVLLLLLCVLCWHPLPVHAASTGRGDWWMFHHDLQHTGRSPFIGPASPEQLWAFFPTRGYIYSSPAIGSDGTIYIGSSDDNLYALNPDGTEQWAFATGNWINSSPAIGSDGTIYVGSEDANLYAINPDGTQKWAFPTGNGIISSPAIGADGTIYIGSYDDHLYAVNPDGTQKWAFPTGWCDQLFPGHRGGRDDLHRVIR